MCKEEHGAGCSGQQRGTWDTLTRAGERRRQPQEGPLAPQTPSLAPITLCPCKGSLPHPAGLALPHRPYLHFLGVTLNPGCCPFSPHMWAAVGQGPWRHLLTSWLTPPFHRHAVKTTFAFHRNSAAAGTGEGAEGRKIQHVNNTEINQNNTSSALRSLPSYACVLCCSTCSCRALLARPALRVPRSRRSPFSHRGQSHEVTCTLPPPPDPQTRARTPCVLTHGQEQG